MIQRGVDTENLDPEHPMLMAEPQSASFETFYQSNYRDLVGLAYVLSGSRSASEELAQEAFTAAYRNWAKISRYESPSGWVRRVLVNRSRSRARRLGAEFRAVTRLRARRQPINELGQEDREFWETVRALPKRQAQVIALHYLDDLSIEDIAKVVDCSPGTVKTHLHRGRQSLAETLGLGHTEHDDGSTP